MQPADSPDRSGSGGNFTSTHWSLVARAAANVNGPDTPAGREALDTVLHRYLPALHVHLRMRGYRADEIDDLLQKFVAERVLERNLLAHANAERGRFRSFLLTSLENFVANERRAQRACKRAPASRSLVSLDPDAGMDPTDPAQAERDPADSFDVAWAREALAEALRRMAASCAEADHRGMCMWEVFEERVLNPALHNVDPTGYDVLADRHHCTWKQAANTLATAKRKFIQTLRLVLAEPHEDKDSHLIDQELASLAKALGAARHFEPDESDAGDENA